MTVRDLPREHQGVVGGLGDCFPWKLRQEVSRSIGVDGGMRKGSCSGQGTMVDKVREGTSGCVEGRTEARAQSGEGLQG